MSGAPQPQRTQSLNGQPSSQQPQQPPRQPHQQPHAAPVQSQHPGNIRDRIVEILSSTANGCLTELGYFPGMSQRLHEVQNTAAKWQKENLKLFQDNQQLVKRAEEHEERWKRVSDSDQEKILRIRGLENDVQRLLREKEALMVTDIQVAHSRLLAKYLTMKEHYTIAYHEVIRLNSILHGQGGPPSGPPVPPAYNSHAWPPGYVATHELHQVPVSHPTNQTSATAPPPGAWQGGRPTSAAGAQPPQYISRPQVRSQNNPPQQAQQPVMQNGRRSSGRITIPAPPRRSSANGLTHSAPPIYVHSGASSPSSTAGGTVQQGSSPPISVPSHHIPSGAHGPSAMPATNGINGSHPVVASMHQYSPTEPTSAGSRRLTSVPSPGSRLFVSTNMPPNIQVPPPPLSASSILNGSSFSAPSTPAGASPDPAATAMTINPTDTYLNPPSSQPTTPAAPSPGVFTPQVLHAEPAPMQPSPTEGQQVSPTAPPAGPQPSYNALKRDSISLSDGLVSPEDPQKRPRLQSPTSEKASSEPAPSPSPSPIASEPPPPAGIVDADVSGQTAMVVDLEEDDGSEESDDDEPTVGPDGLRVVEECISMLFEESDDGTTRTCRICQKYFEAHDIDEPTPPFVNAPDEVLEAHCVAEHEKAWELVRNVNGVDS